MKVELRSARAMDVIENAYYGGGPGALSSQDVFLRAYSEFNKDDVAQFFGDNVTIRKFYGRKKSK